MIFFFTVEEKGINTAMPVRHLSRERLRFLNADWEHLGAKTADERLVIHLSRKRGRHATEKKRKRLEQL